MSNEVKLLEAWHPDKGAVAQFNALVGIDSQKDALVAALVTLLAPKRMDAWLHKHHRSGLPFLASALRNAPLVLLSGDVGCGKTALAQSVGSIIAKEIDDKVLVLETPSNIRGSGFVGDLSSRLVAAFDEARLRAKKAPTIVIIDESDDLATSREQNQAHHEDRAGVNVLLKQLDQIGREHLSMAVIMITNRLSALDPAVLRRAVLQLRFARPDAEARKALFDWMLEGTHPKPAEVGELVKTTETIPGYTYSDLRDRLGMLAVRRALKADKPFSAQILRQALADVRPSPTLKEG